MQVSIWLLGVGAVLLFFIPCCLEICLCRSVWEASFFVLLACFCWLVFGGLGCLFGALLEPPFGGENVTFSIGFIVKDGFV